MMQSSFTFQMLVNVVFVAVSSQGLVVVASAQLCVKGLALCYGGTGELNQVLLSRLFAGPLQFLDEGD
jgi:hypothetical protein